MSARDTERQPAPEAEDARIAEEFHNGSIASSDWGSLLADLTRAGDGRPEWRRHDRTHLECALDYPLGARDQEEYEWEAYFFIPESLRINKATYRKRMAYADLQSYIRYAVPVVSLGELSKAEIKLGQDDKATVRELRLIACQLRAAAVREGRAVTRAFQSNEPSERSAAIAGAADMLAACRRFTAKLRRALASVNAKPDTDLHRALRWVDEDVSRIIEMVLGRTALVFGNRAPKSILRALRDASVEQARYRKKQDLDTVVSGRASKQEVEHMEFRRHVLKRFTSSVLWLKPEVYDPKRWAIQALYALAASVAMAFAVAAAMFNGVQVNREQLALWVLIVLVAYAAKDRIKAALQGFFAKAVAKRLPDRRWRISDRERGAEVAVLDETTEFIPEDILDRSVFEARRAAGRHALEDEARPEIILGHKKRIRVRSQAIRTADERLRSITEIFRMDLRRWLVHTDDPKQQIVYADAEAGRVRSAMAPRVYNISVVYRLRPAGQADAAFRRVRVVVTRKGIRRLDHVDLEDPTTWAP